MQHFYYHTVGVVSNFIQRNPVNDYNLGNVCLSFCLQLSILGVTKASQTAIIYAKIHVK
jgi:hypothetical protein